MSRAVVSPSLRAMSWNIHAGVGTDGAYDLQRIADVINAAMPDVVALQECVQPRFLAEATGMQAVVGEAPGVAFNAVLTRLPVLDVGHANLSVQGREARGVLDVLVDHAGRAVRVLGTHFGLKLKERHHQIDAVLAYLARDPVTDLILLGDFNEWRPGTLGLARLHAALGRAPARRTFPSRLPLFALDRVWTRPFEGLVHFDVVKGLARLASDHLPVVATFVPGGARNDRHPPSWLHAATAR